MESVAGSGGVPATDPVPPAAVLSAPLVVAPVEAEVKELVRKEVERVDRERSEAERRKKNLVIFGIPEDGGKDKEKIRKLFRALRVGPISVSRFFRVGKRREGVVNARPLLVSVGSVYEKREVLRAAPSLAQVRGYERVFIRSDQSPQKRAEFRKSRGAGACVGGPPVPAPGASAVGPAVGSSVGSPVAGRSRGAAGMHGVGSSPRSPGAPAAVSVRV